MRVRGVLAAEIGAFALFAAAAPGPARASDGAVDARDEPLLLACGAGDGALSVLAREAARRKLAGLPPPSSDELTESLRASGDTRVEPRLVTLSGAPVDREEGAQRVRAWAKGLPAKGRRCAVASLEADTGREAIAVVAVRELATLRPVPTSVRPWTWVTIDAKLPPPATGVRVVLLGPRGAPRDLPTSFDGQRAMARFFADRPGIWLAQVIADEGDGPRPVAEARVRVGAPTEATEAPGENETAKSPEDTLFAMMNAARGAERIATLVRSPELDRLARKHAEEMAKRGVLAHDVGDGMPDERVDAAGIEATKVGENVARASTIGAAHRAIWASPSHRENLVSRQYAEAGVGVVLRDGVVWVTELFVAR